MYAGTRMAGESFATASAASTRRVAHDGPFSAIYEIDGPHVLISPGWAKAVEEGRWPSRCGPSRTTGGMLQGALIRGALAYEGEFGRRTGPQSQSFSALWRFEQDAHPARLNHALPGATRKARCVG